MRDGKFLCDGKAETRAALVARTRLFHAVEPLKQVRDVLLGNAHAVVGDCDLRAVAEVMQPQADPAAVRRVLDRVGGDVDEDLLDADLVAEALTASDFAR